jgi:hypothetical protein
LLLGLILSVFAQCSDLSPHNSHIINSLLPDKKQHMDDL